MKTNWGRLHRKTHYWAAIIISIPVIIVLISGLLLQVKKEVDWVQPPTIKGQGKEPTLSFEAILASVTQDKVPEAAIKSWKNIKKLDIRPKKGVVKVRAKNGWEVQIDHQTGDILQVAYRRSDLIEEIHDGSFFHKHAKLWLFLPSAVILALMWITGMYLFAQPIMKRRDKRKKIDLQSRRPKQDSKLAEPA